MASVISLAAVAKVAGVGRDSCQRQVAHPMVGVLLWNLGIKFEGALGVTGSLEASRVNVELNGGGLLKRGRERLCGVILAAHGVEDARFGFQVLKAFLVLDGSVFPLERFFQIVIVVQAPLRGFVVSGPGEAADAAQLVFDALQHHGFGVHGNVERNGQLFPSEGGRGGVRLNVIEDVGQRFKRIRRMRFDSYTQRVLFFVVAEAAPGGGVLGKNDSPLILVGDGVQSIGPRRQRLSFDGNVIGENDGCVFIGTRAPDFSIGHGLAPDFAAADRRPVIGDGDVAQANPLRYRGTLADARNIQLGGLTAVLELRGGVARQGSAG